MAETTTFIDLCSGNDCHDSVNCDPSLSATENITSSLYNFTSNCFNSSLTSSGTSIDDIGRDNSEIVYMDPSYYAVPYRIIGTIFQGLIFIIGVLGNIMVVFVVMRTRSMKTPTNCYLVSLSIADLLVLIASVPNEIVAYYVLGDKWIWGSIGCGLFIFFQYFGINASSLSITAFTIERYIAICHPMRAQKMCTVHRAKRIIVVVWTFAFFYCSPWLFLTMTKPIYYKGHYDVETCTYKLSRQYYRLHYFADMIIFYVFPLILSCILYGKIAQILFNNDIQKNTGNSKSRNGQTSTNIADSKKSSNAGQDQARVQVVKMLVVVVAVFATLWLPYRALMVYNSFAEHRYMELWYLMFSKTMIFVNSAINPIIYSACSIKFRRAFKKMLTCERSGSERNRNRTRGGQYTSGLSTTMHLSTPNSVRQTQTLLTTCAVKTTSNFQLSNMEHGV